MEYWNGIKDWSMSQDLYEQILVDWNDGMERWNGALEWGTGMEYWRGYWMIIEPPVAS